MASNQLFELLTGTHLFVISTWGQTTEKIDDEHLQQLISVLGPLPQTFARSGRDILCINLTVVSPPSLFSLPFCLNFRRQDHPLGRRDTTDEASEEGCGPEMGTGEVEAVEVLLMEILQHDPAKRPMAVDLLKSSWFEAIAEST